MTVLMRGFSRVDDKGRIPVPKNMAREAQLQPGQLIEFKVMGAYPAQYIMVRPRRVAR